MATLPKPPQGELGSGGSLSTGVAGWQAFAQEGEYVPELAWPMNVRIYERMLTDAQVWSLYIATCLPLLDYSWWIEPGESDTDYAQPLADDLGLPLGEPAPDAPYTPPGPGVFRFDFLDHLYEALLALVYGHYYFEQVGEVIDGLWRLRKLGPRAPQTIEAFDIDSQGGLNAIRQMGVITAMSGRIIASQPVIPVDRLVAYVWQSDARNRWVGRSLLRPLYRHWLVKDRLVRVDAINHERAGGVPWVKTDQTFQGRNLDDLQALASEFRVGEDAGGALPPGAELMLARAGGTDVIASMEYHDQAMARVWSSMVIMLATQRSGSYALGESFRLTQTYARKAIARWFSNIFREHVIEDWWLWNVPGAADAIEAGHPLPHPVLASKPPPDPVQERATVDQTGISSGVSQPPGPAASREGRRSRNGPRAAQPTSPLSLPDRPLHREPNAGEIRAAVDFAQLDISREDAAKQLQTWYANTALPEQVAAISDSIVLNKAGEARTIVKRSDMAKLAAPVPDAARIAEMLLPVARQGAASAVSEAIAQGVTAAQMPSDALLAKHVADHAAAIADQLANGLSLAAQRKAVQVAAGRTPKQVATEVVSYLHGLKHAWESDQLSGAAQMALNTGRFAAMATVPAQMVDRFQASELLDENTCDPCASVDGEDYASLDEAEMAYPSGGFLDCEGGPRCRGTIVAIYGSEF